MIVVMRSSAKESDVADVIERIQKNECTAHVSGGEERTVIGVIGTKVAGFSDMLASMPGVEAVIPVTKRYKLASREFHPKTSVVMVGDIPIGGDEVVVMAGPCSIENEDMAMATAKAVKAAGAKIMRGGAFKPRTSPYLFRGLGEEGLKIMARCREETGLRVITEVMTPADVELVARYTDILQIGARNMQNFQLLEECGRTGMPVLIKRGLSATIEEWLLAAEYVLAQGNPNVLLCERGIRTYETATRNTLDLSAVPLLKKLSHLPVIADPSHGTGKWYLVPTMSAASIAAGADGLILEVHPNPDQALSDGPQSLTYENFENLMPRIQAVAEAVGRYVHKPQREDKLGLAWEW